MNSEETNPAETGPQDGQESAPASSLNLLADMSPEQAREYVQHHIIPAKKMAADLATIEQDLTKWNQRVALAREKGMADLTTQAEMRGAELQSKKDALVPELWALEQEITQMRQELTRLSAFRPAVDAHDLLAQMENLVGKDVVEDAKISKKIEEQSLDDELAALKAKLKGPKDTPQA